MDLPIDVVTNHYPLLFRWKQSVNSPIGTRLVEYESALPSNVENVVRDLVLLAKGLAAENEKLLAQVEAMTKRAEVPAAPVPPVKKGKG